STAGCLFRDARADVFLGDDDVIEPDGLLVLVVLAGGVRGIVAVVFEPEDGDLGVVGVAPADVGEVVDELAVEPHGLAAAGLAEGAPLVVLRAAAEPEEVVGVLVVGGESHIDAGEDAVVAGEEPFLGFAAGGLALFHGGDGAALAGMRLISRDGDRAALVI